MSPNIAKVNAAVTATKRLNFGHAEDYHINVTVEFTPVGIIAYSECTSDFDTIAKTEPRTYQSETYYEVLAAEAKRLGVTGDTSWLLQENGVEKDTLSDHYTITM